MPGCHEVYFEALRLFDGPAAAIEVPPVESPIPPDEWGAERLTVTTNGDATNSVEIAIHIPQDAAVGAYAFKALVREKGETDALSERTFVDPVTILFNPWRATDDVYAPDPGYTDEYVLNENGQMWRGSAIAHLPKSWRFASFDPLTLKVSLDLLDGLSASEREDPVLVSRHLSNVINSSVLEGNWSGDYTGGKSPSFWSGSDQILAEFDSTGLKVKFGQCWVYGGTLTSVLRSVGIPARPISNFKSGHDTDANKNIDFYYDTAGRLDDTQTQDSIWNYHVWCDAWMKRPDLAGGHDGWQAVDATPQELSGGDYQLGPAPHSAVRADAGGLYDVDFVFAEVNADVLHWLQNGTPPPDYALTKTDTDLVGQNITTKGLSGNFPVDITSCYKASPARGGGGGGVVLPESGIVVDFSGPEAAGLGSPVVWVLSAENPSAQTWTLDVSTQSAAVIYDGTVLSVLDDSTTTITLGAGEMDTVEVTIDEPMYIDWIEVTRTLRVSVGLFVRDTSDVFLDTQTTFLLGASIGLTPTPNAPIAIGDSISVNASYVNPLATTLTNVVMTFAVGGGLTVDGGSESEVPLGAIPAGQGVNTSKDVVGVGAGSHLVTVTLRADQLGDVFGDLTVEVFSDCNANGISDTDDIATGTSLDCNVNEVPDECDLDCNGNGIPDDCDIEGGAAPDCNADGVPDSCDIAQGTSEDCNENGVPDECDIGGQTSEDVNENGIPDECECDLDAVCDGDANGDGIVDPLDNGFIVARLGLDPCVDDNCPADANCDGGIDPLDLGYVSGRQGTCDPPVPCVLSCP